MKHARRTLNCVCLAAIMQCGLALAAVANEPDEHAKTDFEKTFAPIVIRNCIQCHNSSEAKGGLNLTSKSTALQGGDSGEAIVPGKPEESLMVERVAEGSMPPKERGARLSKDDVAALSAWIKAGAIWPQDRKLSPFELTTDRRAGYDWWSLKPVRRPKVPANKTTTKWGRGAIDEFVFERLAARGLAPAPKADRAAFIRRATFDLIGLPPTPGEIADFLHDESETAYEKLVDRLLDSPHYGERWGRHWLDVVRFGESDGFENDKLRAESWHYRDWVIESFNADKPYDEFIEEQLAGDALSPATREKIAATGFLVAGPWDEVQNVAKSPTERLRAHEEQMEELVAAVSQTFLGLTANCARCHDHKFDPIAQNDYYRVKAVFEGVDHGNRPFLTPAEEQARAVAVAPIAARIAELKRTIDDLNAQNGAGISDRIAAENFVEGRFGETFAPKKTQLVVRSKPAWHAPPLTVECWAKVASKTSFNILLADSLKESSEHWELYTYAGVGDFSVYLPGFEPAEIRSGIDIADGQWHYVAFIFDGRAAILFVDGKRAVEVPVKRLREGGALGSLCFAAYPPQSIGLDGLVDEVRISNTLRKIERVPEGAFALDAETVGLWHFNRGEGERIRDLAAAAAGAPGDPKSATDEAKRTQDEVAARLTQLAAQLKQSEAELAAHPLPLVYAGVRKQPSPTVVFERGDIRKPGETVAPGGIAALGSPAPDLKLPVDAPEAQRRLKFAEWVASKENPLTARVMVNRIWQHHFGQGLVETPSDFGFNGGHPSHPELLDWLAAEFMSPEAAATRRERVAEISTEPPGDAAGGRQIPTNGSWSIKRLHRLIMLSAAYWQSSRFNPAAAAIDADNRLLWRYAPQRLEAEIVRDAMLSVSGELNSQVGGPSFRPFTVTALLTQFYHLIDDGRPEFNRRTIYRINVNTAKSPFLDALDCPAPSLSAPRRRSTTTTLQALALMNDSFVNRQAAKLAERMARSAGPETVAQITLAWRTALARPPTDRELAAAGALAAKGGLESVCWALLNSSEFLYVQ
ncbi:MAG TPA: DUF1553 domain-containing protein [Planctomycetaceae bacterium]|nr:DUF1553 domain-containing protein [Planctomycetaceae bacterium]